MEYTGAEEVSHVVSDSAPAEQNENKEAGSVFQDKNGNGKPESKPGNNGTGKASQAQCRALYALSRKTKTHETTSCSVHQEPAASMSLRNH